MRALVKAVAAGISIFVLACAMGSDNAGCYFDNCGYEYRENYNVYLMDNLDYDTTSAAIISMFDWQTKAEVSFKLHFASSCPANDPIAICVFDETAAEFHKTIPGHPSAIGYTSSCRAKSNIYIDSETVSDLNGKRLILLHEFGHAMGLQHTQEGTIMFASIGSTQDIQCVDVQQFDALRGWSKECPGGEHYQLSGK